MDSETRSKLKQLQTELSSISSVDMGFKLEMFTDWVYDLAYRKGWYDGLWRQDADYSHQTHNMSRKKRTG